MAKQKSSHNAFIEQVRIALSNYRDPEWLSTHSPLATPYFLSQYLATATDTPIGRGQALQRLLDQAAHRLWGDTPLPSDRDALLQACEAGYDKRKSKSRRYRYTLLELCYFRRYLPPDMYPRDRGECQVFLEVGRNPFYEHINKTIAQLSDIILTLVQPTFRLESPVARTALVGREALVQQAVDRLLARETLALSGAAGVGKTALGMAVAAAWPGEAVFWLTFRPNLNDTLSSVVFTLAHFLHTLTQGNSLLWQQMVADKGTLQPEGVWLGLLRNDLEQVQMAQPLICFDDVDFLRATHLTDQTSEQQAIITFIESLSSDGVALLLIGQQMPLIVESQLVPPTLTNAQAGTMLNTLTAEEAAQLQTVCMGNPRMLGLCAMLHEQGEPIASIVAHFPKHPSVRALWDRLWVRLPRADRQLLMDLSVYRAAAPGDVWRQQWSQITHLAARGLLQIEAHDGLLLLPSLRHNIYHQLPREQRDALHAQAAQVRAQRGDYTAAAYHAQQAGAHAQAVEVWYQHAELEISRGQAETARKLFNDIPLARLNTARRAELVSIRNQLSLLMGDAQRVLAEAHRVVLEQRAEDEVSAEILTQQADAHALLGHTSRALDAYTNAATTTARLLRKASQIAHKKVHLHLRHSTFEEAREEANSAQCYAEFALGAVSALRHEYSVANAHLHKALTLAQMLDNSEMIPTIHRRLSIVAGSAGQIDIAQFHAEQAIVWFQKIGDILRMEWMRADLAGMYLQVKKYDAVIEPAESALSFFEKINNLEAISATSSNLAEAWLELGDLQKARKLALRVVQLEEPMHQPFALYTLGLVMQRSGQLRDSAEMLRSGLQLGADNPGVCAYLHRALGQTLFCQGHQAQAVDHFEQALAMFTDIGLEQERVETRQALRRLE